MSDRLTQLQDAINLLADQFCNSIGLLQQSAPSSTFVGFEKSGSKEPGITKNVRLFCNVISRTSKDIDVLIDSLPDEESTTRLQASFLNKLEIENNGETEKLRLLVKEGEERLNKLQEALVDIAKMQLETRKIQAAFTCGTLPQTYLPPTKDVTGDFSELPQR